KKPEPAKKAVRQLKSGDEVKVLTLGQKGTLLEQTGDKEWSVQMGIMKMKVKEKDMEFIKSAPDFKQEKAITAVKGKEYTVSL
ncbi:MutS2/Smr-associated SH3 domain-containing protein, partial [Bacillus pumilus]|uniref:MutS2/Smr-associated SH3 domain-containing protein n=1 Tax=Bacillus pumilus TaxID=1408 RepID=UPI003B67CCD5